MSRHPESQSHILHVAGYAIPRTPADRPTKESRTIPTPRTWATATAPARVNVTIEPPAKVEKPAPAKPPTPSPRQRLATAKKARLSIEETADIAAERLLAKWAQTTEALTPAEREIVSGYRLSGGAGKGPQRLEELLLEAKAAIEANALRSARRKA